MAKHKKTPYTISKVGESITLRNFRIESSNNRATLRTRIVRNKIKYNRKLKHKKSSTEAGDFSFIERFFIMFHVKHYESNFAK